MPRLIFQGSRDFEEFRFHRQKKYGCYEDNSEGRLVEN